MMKSIHAPLEEFLQSPTKSKLEKLLREHGGESNNLEFKTQWPEMPKVARLVLAIGNSGGGVVVVGVSQKEDGTLHPEGLDKLPDKANIQKGLKKYIPHAFDLEVVDFADTPTSSGKNFQVIFIADDPKILPLVCESDGDGIKKAAIYVRRGTNVEEANYEELQRVINKRVETAYSSANILKLEDHIEELRTLYRGIRTHLSIEEALFIQTFANLLRDNPNYPKEGVEEFLSKMIKKKKIIIEELIARR